MKMKMSNKSIMLVSTLAILSIGIPLLLRFPNTADAQTDNLCFIVNEEGERIPLDHLCIPENRDTELNVNESELERIYKINFNEAIPLQERLAIVNQAQQDPQRAIENARFSICKAAGYADGDSCPIHPSNILIEDKTP